MAKKGLPAIHPGEFLAETLEELGLSQAASRAPSGCRRCGFRM
ncbi:MAG: hypothetical protein ACREWE_01630 [Gammaproteobacteria bacterium]